MRCSRALSGYRYAYIWAVRMYLGTGMDRKKTALPCVVEPGRMEGESEPIGL